MIDAFAKSSNVGAIRLAQKLGKERLHDYINLFGFGRKTGVELPGESRGTVHPLESWRPDSIGSVAIGQEVTITPLQAVAAMAAIANHGIWIKPHVVKQVVAQSGTVLYEAQPETRKVISKQSAQLMTTLLERVVTHGTARNAIQLAGYTAAGKTGTPQKAEKGRGYSSGKFMPTFAGFVPANNPRFAIIVMIDEPIGLHQGGSVSAPVFNQIAEAALGDYAVQPDDQSFRQALVAISKKYEASVAKEEQQLTPIDIVTEVIPVATPEPKPSLNLLANAPPAANTSAARASLVNNSDKLETARSHGRRGADISANIIKSPSPTEPTPRAQPPNVPQATPQNLTVSLMPDLRGRGVRAVMQACSQMKLEVQLRGQGLAARQFPAPGARVKPGDACKVEFQ